MKGRTQKRDVSKLIIIKNNDYERGEKGESREKMKKI